MKKVLFALLLPAFLLANTELAAAGESCQYTDSDGNTRYASDGTTKRDSNEQYYTCTNGTWKRKQ